MTKINQLNKKDKNLIRRYLVWFYKDAKEELDKIDRYFTQRIVDNKILNSLKKCKGSSQYIKRVGELEQYFKLKHDKASMVKYSSVKTKKLSQDYEFLSNKFKAVESAIKHFLGAKELKSIEEMYESEMTQRILTAREHR